MDFWTGYAVFHWVATWANPPCDVFFRAATGLGDHTFYYLAVAPLFWVVDRRRACILFLLILASAYMNTAAKLIVHTTRPDPALVRVLDPRLFQSGSPAFPSGHAQSAVVFWGYLAWWAGRRWFWGVALLCVALISFSRLYLAVHYPIDIAGGLILGVASLAFLTPLLERWADANFAHSLGAGFALVAAALAVTLLTNDLSMSLISGSFVGFLAGAVWLPQSPLVFKSRRHSAAGISGGLLALGLVTLPFQWVSLAPLPVFIELTALWIVTLWCYPQLLRRLRLVATID